MMRTSSALFGRGTKPKIFLPFLDFRRGVWGEPTKSGKEIFGFDSPLQSPKRAVFVF
jgi:hypothetical protein